VSTPAYDVINRSVVMETKLRALLLLATLLALLGASSTVGGDGLVEDFYRRFNSSRGADLVFVLDKSGSVSRRLWISMVNFLKVLHCIFCCHMTDYKLRHLPHLPLLSLVYVKSFITIG